MLVKYAVVLSEPPVCLLTSFEDSLCSTLHAALHTFLGTCVEIEKLCVDLITDVEKSHKLLTHCNKIVAVCILGKLNF